MASSRRPSKQPAKRRESGILLRGFVATGEVIARNPAIAGGTTAFLVSLCFVSANALWYQPHFYDGAFFATRHMAKAGATHATPAVIRPSARPEPQPDREITGAVQTSPSLRVEREGAGSEGNIKLQGVQSALADLGLYGGTVDGLNGPQTKSAIANYQRILGIEASGEVDENLLRHLGLDEAAQVPPPTPRPTKVAAVASAPDTDRASVGKSETKKIQAGLKAFGNDGIEVDGVAGADTHAALREFQSLFGLPVTGEPNGQVLAKMKDIGLVN